MELSQLRMFRTVANVGSMARAADLLHCVPSNITARIKNLEDELGVRLFHRDGRKLRISSAGETFLAYAEKILSLADEAVHAVSHNGPPRGRFVLGAIESSATGRLPRLLARYQAAYPDVTLQVCTGTWSQLLDDIRSRTIDAAVVAVDVADPALVSQPVYVEPLILIAPESMGALRTAEDLRDKTIFMWPEGCPYRAALVGWLSKHGESIPITNIASYGTIVGCVSAGAGVSLVPKGVYERYALGTRMKGYKFPELPDVQNHLIWSAATSRNRAREAFVSLMADEFWPHRPDVSETLCEAVLNLTGR
jgi:DNA-binding transcriptional LysR family regulator